jgi:hypothetical protein
MSESELINALGTCATPHWLRDFRDNALEAHREISAAVDFAEQASDAEHAGAAVVFDLEFATSALHNLTAIADELREMLEARAKLAADRKEEE